MPPISNLQWNPFTHQDTNMVFSEHREEYSPHRCLKCGKLHQVKDKPLKYQDCEKTSHRKPGCSDIKSGVNNPTWRCPIHNEIHMASTVNNAEENDSIPTRSRAVCFDSYKPFCRTSLNVINR